MSTSAPQDSSPVTVVVYSDDSTVRSSIITALGSQIAADLPRHRVKEFATGPALRSYVDEGNPVALFILDGEAVPEGGMGISRQLKDEVFNCPPVLLIAGRVEDAWLASWSMADAIALHPIDPFTLADKAAPLLRSRLTTSR